MCSTAARSKHCAQTIDMEQDNEQVRLRLIEEDNEDEDEDADASIGEEDFVRFLSPQRKSKTFMSIIFPGDSLAPMSEDDDDYKA